MGEGREKALTGHNNDMVICKMLAVYQLMFRTSVESAIACAEAWIAPIELGRKLEEDITESEKEELVNKIGEYAKEWLYKLKTSPERKMICAIAAYLTGPKVTKDLIRIMNMTDGECKEAMNLFYELAELMDFYK